MEQLKCTYGIAMPHENAATNSHHASYHEFYSAKSRAVIETRFSTDLAAYGYSFEGGAHQTPGPEVFVFPLPARAASDRG